MFDTPLPRTNRPGRDAFGFFHLKSVASWFIICQFLNFAELSVQYFVIEKVYADKK